MSAECNPRELLDKLGIERVVWIDDMFDQTIDNLFEALKKTPKIIVEMPGFEEAASILDEDGFPTDEGQFEDRLRSGLESLSQEDQAELNKRVRKQGAYEEGQSSKIPSEPEDLATETAKAICEMLGINDEDCRGFEDGRQLVNSGFGEASHCVAIIVDMQNAMQGSGLGDQAGLEILNRVYTREGEEMVFVLTHESAPDRESDKEEQIVNSLEEAEIAQRFPCVISKQRLQNKSGEALSNELKIALKRSSLRREVYRVSTNAKKVVSEAVEKTRDSMCKIPPEELDYAFVKRAVNEGVSDLHMIERIITGQVSKSIKKMFVDHRDMHERMRMIRSIQIDKPAEIRHEAIENFRYDEIWDEGDFLEASHAPLAIGDVFETVAGDVKRRFILLGQPCDLMLRSDGKRSAQFGEFVSFSEIANDHFKGNTVYAGRKTIDLLIGEGGQYLRFDFRKSSAVDLRILELATLNKSGRVLLSNDLVTEESLLPGQIKALKTAKKFLATVISAHENSVKKPEELRKIDAHCTLTLNKEAPFNSIYTPYSKGFYKEGDAAALDWNLKRCGRLRSPYVDILADQHVALLNRRAIDIDYLEEPKG